MAFKDTVELVKPSILSSKNFEAKYLTPAMHTNCIQGYFLIYIYSILHILGIKTSTVLTCLSCKLVCMGFD